MPSSPPPPDGNPSQNPWSQASLAMTIPMMMAAGPLLGFLLGLAVDRWLDPGPPWNTRIKVILMVLCTVAGLRETIKLIKRISADSS